jgi:hypothetical protein
MQVLLLNLSGPWSQDLSWPLFMFLLPASGMHSLKAKCKSFSTSYALPWESQQDVVSSHLAQCWQQHFHSMILFYPLRNQRHHHAQFISWKQEHMKTYLVHSIPISSLLLKKKKEPKTLIPATQRQRSGEWWCEASPGKKCTPISTKS